MSRLGQPTQGGPPAWELNRELTILHHKKLACYTGPRARDILQ